MVTAILGGVKSPVPEHQLQERVQVLYSVAPVRVVGFDGDGPDGGVGTEEHARTLDSLVQSQECQLREVGAQLADHVRPLTEQGLQSRGDTAKKVVRSCAHHQRTSKETASDGVRDAGEGLLDPAPDIALDVQLLQLSQKGQVDERPARSVGLGEATVDRDLESAQARQWRQ
ncbi:hypothetical protein PMZ80_011141 [Knufia obscura]|uniref:Uncharacterized protein n=1 Tax=Knufia obscura TaxID=1635080 RepID=A0ABR0R7M6_9EURO|nr:hypothetical protein PMZ80_011141 [Knufia obscura]